MAIEKSLSQAPMGLGALPIMEEGPEIEIEIEDPEAVEIGIDGMPILRIEEEEPSDKDFDANLAEYMSEDVRVRVRVRERVYDRASWAPHTCGRTSLHTTR